MVEDGSLQVAEPRTRFDPDLLDQHPSRTLVCGECLGLPTESVEAEDQLLPEPFSERVLAHQRFELGDKGRVDIVDQVEIDAHLGGSDPEPVEASTLLGADRHLVEPFERGTAPPPERRTELRTLDDVAGCAMQEHLESLCIDLLGIHRKQVAAP